MEKLVTPERRSSTAEAQPQVASPASEASLTIADSIDQRAPSGRPADLMPGHRLVRVTDGPEWDRAEAFVHDLYVRIGYTQPSPNRRVTELEPYRNRSIFNVVMNEDDRIIGTLRNIYGPYAELPVSGFERTDYEDGDPVVELSSLVVDPTQRSTGVIEHLYRAGWRDAWRSGASALVALIDDWLFDAFVDSYRLPFRRVGVAEDYMGTHPCPVALPLSAPAYERHVRENPDFWAWILEGILPREAAEWELPILLREPPARMVQQDEGVQPLTRWPSG